MTLFQSGRMAAGFLIIGGGSINPVAPVSVLLSKNKGENYINFKGKLWKAAALITSQSSYKTVIVEIGLAVPRYTAFLLGCSAFAPPFFW